MAKTKYIGCNGPAYRGAPQPAFKPECINESRFEDGARFKEFSAEISPTGVCSIYWLAQEEPKPTKKFEDEVKRAFKANGAKPGDVIKVTYESRDEPGRLEYDLAI